MRSKRTREYLFKLWIYEVRMVVVCWKAKCRWSLIKFLNRSICELWQKRIIRAYKLFCIDCKVHFRLKLYIPYFFCEHAHRTFFCFSSLFTSFFKYFFFFFANLCSLKSDQEAAATSAVSKRRKKKCNCGCKFLICSLFICRLPSLSLSSFLPWVIMYADGNKKI